MSYEPSFIESARATLQDRRRAIMERNREKIVELLGDEAQRLGDSIDITTAEQTAGTDLRLQARLRDALHEIEEALQRIEDEEYGECGGCGEEISEKRLRAYPTANLCVDCKEEREHEAKRRYKRPGLLDEFS